MTTFQEAVSTVKAFNATRQARLESWPAYLGNEDGVVRGSANDFVYVRYPSANSPAVEVYNGGVPLVANLRVMVGYRAEQPDLLQALGVADVRADATVVTGGMKPHAPQHTWGYSDPVYLTSRQIMNLAVYRSSGFVVQIVGGLINVLGIDYLIADQTIDLSASVPTSGARYVLITIDTDGTLDTEDGAIVADTSVLALSDIPVVNTGNVRLAAVRLYSGQTQISDIFSNTDILDLRWQPGGIYQTFTSASIPFADANGYLIEDNDLLIWDATNKQLRRGHHDLGGLAAAFAFAGLTNFNNANDNSAVTSAAVGDGFPVFTGIKINGSVASPSGTLQDNILLRLSSRGYGASAMPSSSRVRFDMLADENWTDSAHGTRIEIWTTPNGSTTIAKAVTIGDDKAIKPEGDLYFTGGAGSGLPYGSCYGNEIGWSQAAAAQNTWYVISDTDMTDGHGGLNLVAHDGSGLLGVSKAGRYMITYTVSQTNDGNNKHIQTGIAIDGTVISDGINHIDGLASNIDTVLAGNAIVSLTANQTIQIAIRTTDTGTPTISVDHLNITIFQVGG